MLLGVTASFHVTFVDISRQVLVRLHPSIVTKKIATTNRHPPIIEKLTIQTAYKIIARTMTALTRLVRAIVAIHIPLSALSMETENGYLCNLCHSRQNEYPYPPPRTEGKVVRFTKSENEQFGLPWDRGITCLDVWNTVLDFANPNVVDEASCRSMAAVYAPQCCFDFPDESDEVDNAASANAKELSSTQPQLHHKVVSKSSTVDSRKPNESRPSEERKSSSSTDTGRNNNEDEDNNVRRTAAVFQLRGGEKRK